ncbi:cytosine deaminase [Paramyrothecium foliicola]|nr:cytosine deaminase [Paramyrothecium foliicola]
MTSSTEHHSFLRLAVDLAREAVEAGDAPFGSVLVGGDGKVLQTDRNRTITGQDGDGRADATLHPEFTLARWAALNLSPEERAKTTVYTSGEHCAMCSAAHAYCGLGRIVYASSTEQYGTWLRELGQPAGKVSPLSIQQVAPHIPVEGPVLEFAEEIKELHRQRFST